MADTRELTRTFPMSPWRFDGHGINDREGQRICKVTCAEPYLYDSGQPVRNEGFDRLSNLIASAPELLEALERCTRELRVYADHFGTTVESEQCSEQAEAAIRKARGEL